MAGISRARWRTTNTRPRGWPKRCSASPRSDCSRCRSPSWVSG
jgi:hypothetical protein